MKEMVDFILLMTFESDKPARRSGPSDQKAKDPTVIV